jgi:hypothetical protein
MSLTQNTAVHAEVCMTLPMESLRRDIQKISENLGVKILKTPIFLDDFINTPWCFYSAGFADFPSTWK